MRGGTLFSGIGAPECAMPWIDWRWSAEIDPFASAVHAVRFPGVLNLGDVERIDADAIEPVDLVVFGSPCQSFSVAGKRLGLDDPRGNLALVGLRLIGKLRPRWVVFENVPGLLSSDFGRDFGAFLGIMGECGYGFAYRVLDAQFAGVPQRRRRVFVVGYLGDWQPPAAVLFEPESLRGGSPPSREAGERVARPVASSPQGGSGYRNDSDTAENLICGTLKAPTGGGPWRGDSSDPLVAAFNNTGQGWWNDAEAAASVRKGDDNGNGGARESTLIAFGGNRQSGPLDASEDGTGRGTPLVSVAFQEAQTGIREYADAGSLRANGPGHDPVGTRIRTGMLVRRLTPRECERLQGFPDDWTAIQYRVKPAANSPRYRALGNSMAVPVIGWIGHRIQLFEDATRSLGKGSEAA